jgi:hypothetical protein
LKPFDPALFELTDRRARDAAISWWRGAGYSAIDNADKYGPDLIVSRDGEDFYVEVETKLGWGNYAFPFATVNIPGRKRKFAKIPNLQFMVFNSRYSRAVIIESEVVLNAATRIMDTRITRQEEFFEIPIEQCKQIKL